MIKVDCKFIERQGRRAADLDVILPKGATIRAAYAAVTGLTLAFDFRPEPGAETELRRLIVAPAGTVFQDGRKDERVKFVCAVTGRRPALVYEIVAY